ncbi:hypothetical protein [Turicimonas muris]|nr:hypothetical protein [Turicimonas muris]
MKKEANDKSQAIYREDTSNYETSLTVKRLLAPILAPDFDTRFIKKSAGT